MCDSISYKITITHNFIVHVFKLLQVPTYLMYWDKVHVILYTFWIDNVSTKLALRSKHWGFRFEIITQLGHMQYRTSDRAHETKLGPEGHDITQIVAPWRFCFSTICFSHMLALLVVKSGFAGSISDSVRNNQIGQDEA